MAEERILECQGCGVNMRYDFKLCTEGDTGEAFCPDCKKAGFDKAVNCDD